MAFPRWEGLQTRSGLEAIGSFSLHTTAAAFCGIFFGPWLLSRWFIWILPLLRIPPPAPRADYWLQHLELVTIIPALVFGALVARYFERLASWAWVVPTMILSYKLLTFTNPNVSVLASADPWSRFSYYFVIQQHMPTFSSLGLSGSDPIRVAQQLDVTAPFYSGIAYSIGALLTKHKRIERVVSSLRREPEPEVVGPDDAGVEQIGEAKEQPVTKAHSSKS
jgi:hypothetical protein